MGLTASEAANNRRPIHLAQERDRQLSESNQPGIIDLSSIFHFSLLYLREKIEIKVHCPRCYP